MKDQDTKAKKYGIQMEKALRELISPIGVVN